MFAPQIQGFMKPASLRENNFDILRICLALFVVIGHAHELIPHKSNDLLNRLTHGIGNFAYLGVAGFFSISGYLVYQSFLRSASYKEFLFKRGLRIFPGLLVNLLFIAFIVSPFLTKIPRYLYTSREPYHFVISNMLLVKPIYNLADIFDKNPYSKVLNGSLWTLVYEFLFYVLFIFLFIARKFIRFKKVFRVMMYLLPVVVFLAALLAYILPQYYIPFTTIDTRQILSLSTWFLMGMWLSHLGDRPLLNKILLAGGLIVFVLTLAGILQVTLMFFSWPIVVVRFGALRTPILSKAHLLGDPSYGIYIYGFFIQQLLIYLGYDTLAIHMTLAIIISTIIGYASWHLVEKKALALKKQAKKSPEPNTELRTVNT